VAPDQILGIGNSFTGPENCSWDVTVPTGKKRGGPAIASADPVYMARRRTTLPIRKAIASRRESKPDASFAAKAMVGMLTDSKIDVIV